MVQHEGTREITIDQRHNGTLLLAGVLALVASFVVTVLVFVLIWQLSNWSGWLLCLLVPGIAVVLLIGSWMLQWGERLLVRLWPSSRHLALDGSALAQKRRHRVEKRVNWHEPFETLRWRTRWRGAPQGALCLACQLVQGRDRISVYTRCSVLDWRRVPGWKNFPFLGGFPSAQRRILSPGRGMIGYSRRSAAPTHRGPSSLPELDPDKTWPAERFRRDHGWALGFDDFCAIMAAVEAGIVTEEPDASNTD
jgi:hypothetical protein